MPMKFDNETVWRNFQQISDKTDKDQLRKFVEENFSEEGTELEKVTPGDWKEKPEFIEKISDDNLRNLATEMNNVWKNLTRKISQSKDEIEARSSLIYLHHPFVVPGGRFREVYYWDSYWTIKGLLLSEMTETTKGMIENFKYLIDLYGMIPNGNRIYYTQRSQPPVFTMIVNDFLTWVNDPTTERQFIAGVLLQLDAEFRFWQSRMVNITINNQTHQLARYNVEVGGPRPESYWEDYSLGENSQLSDQEKDKWYQDMKSGAESGWDYSSRWMKDDRKNDKDELLSIVTGDIIPVDLNSFLCRNAEILAEMYRKVENVDYADHYQQIHEQLRSAIRAVLFDESDQVWYDYNIVTEAAHNKRWYPSNIAPLYVKCHHHDLNTNHTVQYIIKNTVNHTGGVPTSLEKTHQQWDLPNTWPPLVEMVVTALENSNTTEGRDHARTVSEMFVRNVHRSWSSSGAIFEKYNCEESGGGAGAGGEYDVQEGFGWTNGVTMSLLARYPDMSSNSGSGISRRFTTMSMMSVLVSLFFIILL